MPSCTDFWALLPPLPSSPPPPPSLQQHASSPRQFMWIFERANEQTSETNERKGKKFISFNVNMLHYLPFSHRLYLYLPFLRVLSRSISIAIFYSLVWSLSLFLYCNFTNFFLSFSFVGWSHWKENEIFVPKKGIRKRAQWTHSHTHKHLHVSG